MDSKLSAKPVPGCPSNRRGALLEENKFVLTVQMDLFLQVAGAFFESCKVVIPFQQAWMTNVHFSVHVITISSFADG